VKSTTIARNYAEALLLAAEADEGRGGHVELYGDLMDAVAGAIQADERIAVALESPRVAKATKGRLLADALRGTAPAPFVRFLQAVVRRGRQGLMGEIAHAYHALVDVKLNRVHAGVTLAVATNGGLPEQITDRLAQVLGKEVRAHFRTDPAILGGIVVRVGDRIFDGSLRRKLNALRRKMLTGE
jgi:F-type H+-transporting ATPase subunit delta